MDKGKGLCGNGGNGKSVAEQRWLWVLQKLNFLDHCHSAPLARLRGGMDTVQLGDEIQQLKAEVVELKAEVVRLKAAVVALT